MRHSNSHTTQMKTLFALSLAGACGAAIAQAPAMNPMPDGSRDLYVGVGAVSAPEYEGAKERRIGALPLVQLEWSSGIFVSGMSAGMHLSGRPAIEYGPLLAIHPGRDQSGTTGSAGGVTSPLVGVSGSDGATGVGRRPHGLAGMDDVEPRLQAGGFFNYYLSPGLRLTNSVLYGAGRDRDGVAWSLGMQHVAADIAPHHRLSLAAGLTLVNRSHNASFFGVTKQESGFGGHPVYAPRGGVKEVSLAARWNWALSPAWMLASGARVARLQGDARHSPLVQRPTDVSISTGLAYRF